MQFYQPESVFKRIADEARKSTDSLLSIYSKTEGCKIAHKNVICFDCEKVKKMIKDFVKLRSYQIKLINALIKV